MERLPEIIFAYILKIHFKLITPQQHHHHHHHYYDDTLQQYDDENDPDESEESSEYITRRRAKTRKFADTEECFCTCDACFSREGPKPCCNEFCKYCHTNTGIPNQDQYGNQEQKVVFVPFPYPLIVPAQNDNNNAQNADAATEKQLETTTTSTKLDITTKPTTTTSPVTVKSKPVSSRTKLRSKSVEVGLLSRHRQMKQLNPAVKRTRPTWVPKYGIVPIPDHLAAKLMTQLTEVRALKAKRL